MPYLPEPVLMAYQLIVPSSRSASGCADFRNSSTSFSLPGLASSCAQIASFPIAFPPFRLRKSTLICPVQPIPDKPPSVTTICRPEDTFREQDFTGLMAPDRLFVVEPSPSGANHYHHSSAFVAPSAASQVCRFQFR